MKRTAVLLVASRECLIPLSLAQKGYVISQHQCWWKMIRLDSIHPKPHPVSPTLIIYLPLVLRPLPLSLPSTRARRQAPPVVGLPVDVCDMGSESINPLQFRLRLSPDTSTQQSLFPFTERSTALLPYHPLLKPSHVFSVVWYGVCVACVCV